MFIPSRICIPGFLLALLISLGAVAVMGQDVKTTVNPDQDFSKYQKYAWRENRIAPASLPEDRQAIERKIKEVVNRELMKKGYEENAQNPDFFIEVDAAAVPGQMMASANRDLRVPDNVTVYNSQSPGGPGASIWMAITAGVLITVTDSASDETAWEARVSKKYSDPDKLKNKLEKEINNFFKKGLKKFPENKNK
jgi:hypothetical protein